MKFTEMPYVRPELADISALTDKFLTAFHSAASAQEQADLYRAYDKDMGDVITNFELCYARYTIDTTDEFYSKENDYFNEVGPALSELGQKVSKALLASQHRPTLDELLGKLLFTNLEIAARSFDPKNMELMAEENKLQSQYQKLYASAVVEWEGETIPLPKLGPYKQSPDRAVRKLAHETEGRWFDAHQEELDEIYDKLVKNRTQQARNMGYENYLQLGYDRLGRNCYGKEEIAAFRDQIAKDMVPIVARIKEDQAKRIGVDKLKFYDDLLLFPDGNACPQGTADELLDAAYRMYKDLSPETAEFADFMWGNEMLDVLSKPGKAPGGYCTTFTAYKSPFIFSNFNGTAGDVDVLTHEAGHAFAFFRAMNKGYLGDLTQATIEACEVHSMSMEFLTQDYHKDFFGPLTRKYEIGHCEDALIFIPYGCMVDEFQHRMYENPELPPAERNQVWLELEHKYRPWVDYEDLPFYSRGSGWQWKLHIYLHPLYYIDYCMAQTVAFQFWIASMKDRKDAWDRYLAFADKGGTCTFEELVHAAGLKVPYAPGCIKEIGEAISKWIDENPLE